MFFTFGVKCSSNFRFGKWEIARNRVLREKKKADMVSAFGFKPPGGFPPGVAVQRYGVIVVT